MMKNLLKITEIATLLKSAQFPSHQRYQFQILTAQIEVNNQKLCQHFPSLSLIPSERYGRAGPSLFIVLNESTGPKMFIRNVFQIFPIILKVLELFESRRSDPYM